MANKPTLVYQQGGVCGRNTSIKSDDACFKSDPPLTHPLSGRKEGSVLFNDALNTFYLRLYGVGHMVKDQSDSERKPAAAT